MNVCPLCNCKGKFAGVTNVRYKFKWLIHYYCNSCRHYFINLPRYKILLTYKTGQELSYNKLQTTKNFNLKNG